MLNSVDLRRIKNALTPETREELANIAATARGSVEHLLSGHPAHHVLHEDTARDAMNDVLTDMIASPPEGGEAPLGKQILEWPTAASVAGEMIRNGAAERPSPKETEERFRTQPEARRAVHRALREYDIPDWLLEALEDEVWHLANAARTHLPDETKEALETR